MRDNSILGYIYYAEINDAPLSDLLRQDNIKAENQLMAFSDSGRKDYP